MRCGGRLTSMSIIGLILLIVIVGVVLYYVPMDARLKTIIIVIMALVAGAWLLSAFGVLGSISGARPPRVG